METRLSDCSTHGFIFSPSSSCPFCNSESKESQLGENIKSALKSRNIANYRKAEVQYYNNNRLNLNNHIN